ncbi:MAG: hypothetical protein QG577_1511 [Thermodesulfobacteriota bacterium]|nr:hypothetical protein [Thermodesulfobacteriota bacterium]
MKSALFFLAMAMLICGLCLMATAQQTMEKGGQADIKKSGSLDPKWREFTAPPLAPGERPDAHRVQFGKQDCMECHMRETPANYAQWLGSKHGINSVKCGICHGDALNYRARPDKTVCIGCHSEQVHNMPPASLVTNCSYCHKSHWFTVHKIQQYEKFSPGRANRFNVPGF